MRIRLLTGITILLTTIFSFRILRKADAFTAAGPTKEEWASRREKTLRWYKCLHICRMILQ